MTRIAVSGLGVVTALGRGVDEHFAALVAGHSGVGPLTLVDGPRVPVGEVRASNDELKRTLGLDLSRRITRTALLGMIAAGDALSDADDGSQPRTGLVSGTSTGGMDLTENFFGEFAADSARGRLRDVVGHECADSTCHIAAHLGIDGFRATLSTACSSAANAIILGAGLIRRGVVDRVVAGGTDALCRFTLGGFRSLGILDGAPCRPFDESRAGLNLGEGAGYIVLQSERTLTREPYGWLAGWANACDAFHQTASSAQGEGAWRAMSEALVVAGLEPAEIDYINAHGTGTPNNDASEAAAMVRLFGELVPPFSSTKPFTGHTLAAAGGVEAVISMLAIIHGTIFPSLGFREAMESTPLTPQTTLAEGVPIRHVLSNSFGFGGNNSTLIFSAR